MVKKICVNMFLLLALIVMNGKSIKNITYYVDMENDSNGSFNFNYKNSTKLYLDEFEKYFW